MGKKPNPAIAWDRTYSTESGGAANQEWMDDAVCANHPNPESFFTTSPRESNNIIEQNCRRCPVANRCLGYAKKIGATAGIYGGINFGGLEGRKSGRSGGQATQESQCQ